MADVLGGAEVDALGNPSNDGSSTIDLSIPYVVTVTVEGAATLLFHAWSNEAVAEKAAAKKGSEAKKQDNVESYVYRNQQNQICLPGRYLVGSLTDPRNGAAKYRQDPRSPRKSALDLFKAGVISLTELAPITAAGAKEPATQWDFLDQQRVMVQRAGITRSRPAFHPGWRATLQLMCNTPEYISPSVLHETLTRAGQLVGVGDFRPSYGRFAIVEWKVGLDPD